MAELLNFKSAEKFGEKMRTGFIKKIFLIIAILSAGSLQAFAATLTTTAGAGGTVTPLGTDIAVTDGTDYDVTITPDTGYSIATLSANGASVTPATTYTFSSISGANTLDATFSLNTYTITTSAGTNGSVSPSGDTSVDYGNDLPVTITPDTGYHIDTVTVDSVSAATDSVYTFSSVSADHTLAATFALNTYTISTSITGSGTVTPDNGTIVNYGDPLTITMTPAANYHLVEVTIGGTSVLSSVNESGGVYTYDIASVTADQNVVVTFAIDTYAVTTTVGANGSATNSGEVLVDHGSDLSIVITPDEFYHLSDITLDGTSVLSDVSSGTYTLSNVTTTHSIAITFAIDTYPITTTAGANGSVSPFGSTYVDHGSSLAVTMTPDTGYHIDTVTVDGVQAATDSVYSFENVTASHTLDVSFAINTYTITATAGSNGSITPSTDQVVNYGSDSSTYTITPDSGYKITSVVVDGLSVGAVSTYTFTNVTADHTIEAQFEVVTYSVTTSVTDMSDTPDTGGTITPSGSSVVNSGSDLVISITPSMGYEVNDIVINGTSYSVSGNSYTLSSITEDKTVVVRFKYTGHVISTTTGAGGTITVPDGYEVSGTGDIVVNNGDTIAVTLAASAGYIFASLTIDGVTQTVPGGQTYVKTFSSIGDDHSINSTFTFTGARIRTTTGAGGTVSPLGATDVNNGGSLSVSITPDTGYGILDVLVDSVSVGAVSSYDFTNITSDHTLDATFEFTGATITSTSSANGSVSPSGSTIVDKNGSLDITMTPDKGYSVSAITIDGSSVTPVNPYSFTNITQDHTFNAEFSFSGVKLTAVAGSGGSVSPMGPTILELNEDLPITITPDAGYVIDTVSVTGGTISSSAPYVYNSSTSGDFTLNVTFVSAGTTITASAGTGGSISPSGGVGVVLGADQTFTITTDTGYSLEDVLVDSVSVGAVTSYTFTNIQAAHTISASFSMTGFSIDASAGTGGTISPSGTIAVPSGGSQTYTIAADTAYEIADVLVDGYSVGAVSSYTFSNVTANRTISASFNYNGGTITTTSTGNGSVSPLGATAVASGEDLTITMTPDTGYTIGSLLVDGISIDPVTTYTFTGITEDHTLDVTFILIPTYNISGTVTHSGSGVSGATVYLNGTSDTTTTTDSSGNYSFSDNIAGVYSVSVSYSGYAFSPTYKQVSLTTADASNINFSAVTPWVGIHQSGSNKDEEVMGCHEDQFGNIYIVGSTYGDLDGDTNSGSFDIFLKKYSVSGAHQWTRTKGSTGNPANDKAYGVATDSSGNVYVAGQTRGQMSVSNSGWNDIVLIKYNSSGTEQWVVQTGTRENDSVRDIAISANDEIYITGFTEGDFAGGGNSGSTDVFVMQYDTDGNQVWVSQFGTSTYDEAWGVGTDNKGGIYVTGHTGGSLNGASANGNFDMFVVKLDGTGAIVWTTLAGSASNDEARGIAVTEAGDIYSCGYTVGDFDGVSNGQGDYAVVKLDSEGNILWKRQGGSSGDEYGMGISTFGSDNVYITGYTDGTLSGNTSAGNIDTFIVKYTGAGVLAWQQMSGTDGNDYSNCITSKGPDSVFTAGETTGSFDGNTNAGEDDIAIIKTDSQGTVQYDISTIDGNNDGTADSSQANVSSFLSEDGQKIVTVEAAATAEITSSSASANPSSSDTPSDAEFPYGVISFTIQSITPGGSTSVIIYLPPGSSPDTYYKYGPTPDDTTNHWYEFMDDGQTGATIDGNIITLKFVDGERGDSDLDGSNGIIVDPGAPVLYPTDTGDGGNTDTGDTNNSGDTSSSSSSSSGGGGGGGCFLNSLF